MYFHFEDQTSLFYQDTLCLDTSHKRNIHYTCKHNNYIIIYNRINVTFCVICTSMITYTLQKIFCQNCWPPWPKDYDWYVGNTVLFSYNYIWSCFIKRNTRKFNILQLKNLKKYFFVTYQQTNEC